RGTYVGVTVVAVNAPGVQHALVVDQLMAGPPHVIHDLVLAAFHQSLANAASQIVKHLVPGHALPFAFATFARAPQRIKDAFRVVHLIDRRRTLGAVASAAAGMRGIAFELLYAHLLFVDVSQQAASRFAVEANGGNQGIVPLDSARPFARV